MEPTVCRQPSSGAGAKQFDIGGDCVDGIFDEARHSSDSLLQGRLGLGRNDTSSCSSTYILVSQSVRVGGGVVAFILLETADLAR